MTSVQMRFASRCLVGSTPGNDTNVGLKKMESNRNFANKLWNIGRFVISAIDDQESTGRVRMRIYTLADSWIWAKLQELVRDVERQFQNFQYGQAGQQIYDFTWNDFADWYLEIAKEQLKKADPQKPAQRIRWHVCWIYPCAYYIPSHRS